jgi:hypothetical protein
MGSPDYPDAKQLRRLQEVSELRHETLPCKRIADALMLEIDLPPQAIAAITLEYPR